MKKEIKKITINPDPKCKDCFGNGFTWDNQICHCCKEWWDEWVKEGDSGVKEEKEIV